MINGAKVTDGEIGAGGGGERGRGRGRVLRDMWSWKGEGGRVKGGWGKGEEKEEKALWEERSERKEELE